MATIPEALTLDRANMVLSLRDCLEESVLIFDYPGFGRSGGKPSEAGCYAAADAAFDWLIQNQKVPADHIVIVGKSLGGGVAVDLASRRNHRALVLVKAFTSIPAVAQHLIPIVPANWLMHNRFDSLAKIGNCHRPLFITHGTDDGVIPFSQGQQLYAAANDPKEFFAMEGVGHQPPSVTSECLAKLRQFLAKKAALSTPSN